MLSVVSEEVGGDRRWSTIVCSGEVSASEWDGVGWDERGGC